ncbi:MAG: hypothetical protein WCC17_16025 [Candidatus Nitrosopolaris sp.]
MNPVTKTQTTNVDPTQTTTSDPTISTKIALTKSNTDTNTEALSLRHSFVSNKVVGPDRFRFIGYYWTSSNTNRGVDVGTSANSTYLTAQAQPPNVKACYSLILYVLVLFYILRHIRLSVYRPRWQPLKFI